MNAEVALFARLREDGFQGSGWERFAEELVRYGLDVIGGWVRSGRIIAECRKRGIKGLPAGGRRDLHDGDIADLTQRIVAEAICSYREVLRRDGWSGEQGANLTTFFVGQCLIRFPSAYRQWCNEARPAYWDSLNHEDGTSVDIPDPSEEIEAAIQSVEVADHLRSIDDRRIRQIIARRIDGYTDREIGEQLGMTRKAIEGLLYRYRRRLIRKGGDKWTSASRLTS
jgi:DNA-directed RNA polymerase specialized sigma24 family protein